MFWLEQVVFTLHQVVSELEDLAAKKRKKNQSVKKLGIERRTEPNELDL